MQGVGAAGKIGGEVEGGGGGERDRACGGVWPGWVARPRPSAGARRPQGRVQDFHRDQRHGPRPAEPDGEDDVEQPKARRFRLRPLGRPGRRRTPGRRPLRPRRPDRPPLRKPSGSRRGRSGPQARSSRAAASRIRPGSRLGGRPARSRHSEEVRRGPARVADGEAEVAQRGFVGVEAQDFGRSRGALQREAGAQRPGGRRLGAQNRRRASASPAPAANRGSPSPALPLARAQAGIGAGGGKACAVPRVSAGSVCARARVAGGAERRSSKVRRAVGEQGRNRRESPGHDESCAALCHRLARNPPRLSWGGDVR